MPYITTAERIGIERGITKGEIIGEIRMAQRMLNHPVSSKKVLLDRGINALRKQLRELKKFGNAS